MSPCTLMAGPAGHMSKASRTRCSRTGPVTALSLDANFPGEDPMADHPKCLYQWIGLRENVDRKP